MNITITLKEYEDLKDDNLKLTALEYAGVHNWVGCEEALSLYCEWKKEKSE